MNNIPITTSTKTLEFLSPAQTSKTAYLERKILLLHAHINGQDVIGECAPLPHLSIETFEQCFDLAAKIEFIPTAKTALQDLLQTLPSSLKFAIEGMFLEANLYRQPINSEPIKINGLVWMNDFEHMWEELCSKAEKGFDCIKIKIGQHDFDEECRFLEKVRHRFTDKIELRLDANGAFDEADALLKLKDLSKFQIHSIEQPIKPGNWEKMEEICSKSLIKIALDEELIGIEILRQKALLQKIKPAYLILKPSLHGGFTHCDHWIAETKKTTTQWWATSALESNIGLFQIALWLSKYRLSIPQGLGTGSLFKENFTRPFYYEKDIFKWKL